MNIDKREPKFRTGKEVIEKACQHFFDDKTPEETRDVLGHFYGALDLMETWDDVQPENNVPHDICEKIRGKVEKIAYDDYSNRATYQRFDETIEWISHALFFHDIRHGSNTSEIFEKKVDTSTSITYPYDYWIWLNELSHNILNITKEYGVYNEFMNCILRDKFKCMKEFHRFYTRRRSLVRYNMYRTGDYEWNPYAGKYQVKSSSNTIKKHFLNFVYDNTKSIYSGKPNGEPRLAMAFPEYFGEPDILKLEKINLDTVVLEPTFPAISWTRTVVHIEYCDNGIDIIYKEKDNKVEHLAIDDTFKIGNECREWYLEKENGKYYFRKYRNNWEVLNEVYIRKGDWLLATTSGACRNGMFHPVNRFPIKVHFINNNLTESIRDSISTNNILGTVNGCTVYGEDITNGRSIYIKNGSKYYPLTVDIYSAATTNEDQEQFEKDFNNGDWKNSKISIYRGHFMIKDFGR